MDELHILIEMSRVNLRHTYELRDSFTGENIDRSIQARLAQDTAYAVALYSSLAEQYGFMSEELTYNCLQIVSIMLNLMDKYVTTNDDLSERLKAICGDMTEISKNTGSFYRCLVVRKSKNVDVVRSELDELKKLTSLSKSMSEIVSSAIKFGELRLAGVDASVAVHSYLTPNQQAQNFRMN